MFELFILYTVYTLHPVLVTITATDRYLPNFALGNSAILEGWVRSLDDSNQALFSPAVCLFAAACHSVTLSLALIVRIMMALIN
jgi:hypothetical protein